MTLLEGTNLRKTYRLGRSNTVHALRGVDVAIEPGEMVAIIGPSGSGKSTLMHILGLLHGPDLNHGPRPELTFAGRDIVELGEGERTRIRAREMGFVFQDFNLVPTLTALENVALACDYAGVRGGKARQASLDALALVGLAERAGHRPSELSGGEQQRVAIARALVNRPQLVLADEPTGNLDSERSAEVLATLRRFNREHGQSVVLVTHDNEVAEACDRVIRMRDGGSRSRRPYCGPVRAGSGALVMRPADGCSSGELVEQTASSRAAPERQVGTRDGGWSRDGPRRTGRPRGPGPASPQPRPARAPAAAPPRHAAEALSAWSPAGAEPFDRTPPCGRGSRGSNPTSWPTSSSSGGRSARWR
jgi:putative ABC transport system ATP-binding protein